MNNYQWGTTQEYQSYAEKMRGVKHMTEREFIAGRGESRVGSEHTAEDDKQWHEPKANGGKVLVVDLDTWVLTGANRGALFFERKNA